ncbi:MAG: anaerobic ribonucleoside triphosphate reductase [Ruminococcus sp.]|nr:anaerobic ribonucleoside triphosphate reductase [Ruminococcus sp.]
MTIQNVIKRDGRKVPYSIDKIIAAVGKANAATEELMTDMQVEYVATVTQAALISHNNLEPTVEQIQDVVEDSLISSGFANVAKNYIRYRAKRTQMRDMKNNLMMKMHELTFSDSKTSDEKRENANVNGDTPMGLMLKYGSTAAKEYDKLYVLEADMAQAHENGDIHIHDLDFYTTTTTCTQIDLTRLFENGFNTGHGFLRKPNSIMSYAALAAIAIQANQNDQHGGQAIPAFDYMLAPGVTCTYRKCLIDAMTSFDCFANGETDIKTVKAAMRCYIDEIEKDIPLKLENEDKISEQIAKVLKIPIDRAMLISSKAYIDTDKQTYQAMESFIHNLNTMHSRAGAQVPFSSINYGTDTSEEGRMVIKNVLLATQAGLGNGETPIFPIHIFKVKDGINYEPEDPNYDLFELACEVSAKRLFPNFSFLDSPFNLSFYQEGHPETEVGYMGCRTRVMSNVNGPETTYSRGNLSFTSINLPRLAIEAKGDLNKFFLSLDNMADLCIRQLMHRFKIQCSRKVLNFPFLMGQGVWLDSDKLDGNDTLEEVLKHGSLTVGFIGLAETLVALTGKHHGEDKQSQELGLRIVKHLRELTDKATKDTHLNYALIATPAEGLSGRFVRIDREKYGVIKGVTDREYYTNSFHVPVYYPISAYDKINIEAPYHALTNGGHISYIELDGDPSTNIKAFEKIVRYMKKQGIGYGAINHPIDRDPYCGYTGIIGDTCPNCHRKEFYDELGKKNNIGFDRIRRITGYLVGTVDRFNDAKKAEVHDRTNHSI